MMLKYFGRPRGHGQSLLEDLAESYWHAWTLKAIEGLLATEYQYP